MSAAGDLMAAAPAPPPYDIVRTAWAEFYVEALGLRAPGVLHLRGWEERSHHSLVLREGPVAGVAGLAFRVRSEDDLNALAADFGGRGCETALTHGEQPGIGRALRVREPFGFPLASSPR